MYCVGYEFVELVWVFFEVVGVVCDLSCVVDLGLCVGVICVVVVALGFGRVFVDIVA